MEDIPLIDEDVKTAFVALAICDWLFGEFWYSMEKAKKEGGPGISGVNWNDPVVHKYIKSSEVMAHYGPTELLILRHTFLEAEKAFQKPEVKPAFATAGLVIESKEVQFVWDVGSAFVNTILDVAIDEYSKYAEENIIRTN